MSSTLRSELGTWRPNNLPTLPPSGQKNEMHTMDNHAFSCSLSRKLNLVLEHEHRLIFVMSTVAGLLLHTPPK